MENGFHTADTSVSPLGMKDECLAAVVHKQCRHRSVAGDVEELAGVLLCSVAAAARNEWHVELFLPHSR